ncbi:MAG: hypothetical protein ABF868_04925 [Sporolactobacillus sp.]
MFWDHVKEIQLKIYYLFMLADGKCTKSELSKFESICKIMEVDAEVESKIAKFCEDIIYNIGKENSVKLNSEIVKIIDGNDDNYSPTFLNRQINDNKQLQVEIIWTLVSLGYSDFEYTEPEKEIVDFLSNYWKISDIISNEIIDTAETILALSKQKEWIKTTNKSYDTIFVRINEIDKKMQQTAENIEILISEEDIA